MPIARSGQYAMQAMLHLAAAGSATVGEIAGRTSIPAPFLQQLIAPLKAAGLVATRRGPAGGLALARTPERITLLSVLDAVRTQPEPADRDWTELLPAPHGRRLHDIEHLLPTELALLTLADLVPHWSADAAVDNGALPTEGLPPKQLLEQVGQLAVTLVGADVCSVYFGSSDHGFVTTAYDARHPERPDVPSLADAGPPMEWIPLQPVGVVAATWITGEPIAVTDVDADPRASREWARRFDVQSVLAVPIAAAPDGWGVLIVANARRHSWTPSEIGLIRGLAMLCGLAVVGHNHLSTQNRHSNRSETQHHTAR